MGSVPVVTHQLLQQLFQSKVSSSSFFQAPGTGLPAELQVAPKAPTNRFLPPVSLNVDVCACDVDQSGWHTALCRGRSSTAPPSADRAPMSQAAAAAADKHRLALQHKWQSFIMNLRKAKRCVLQRGLLLAIFAVSSAISVNK